MALRALLLLALLSLLDANGTPPPRAANGTPRAAHTSLRGGGNGRKEVNGSEVHTMTNISSSNVTRKYPFFECCVSRCNCDEFCCDTELFPPIHHPDILKPPYIPRPPIHHPDILEPPYIPKPPYYISTPVNGSEVPNTMATNISNISSYVSARKDLPVP